MADDNDPKRRIPLPAVGIAVAGIAVGSVPFVHPAVSATDGALRWVLWVIAGMVILYMVVTGWRVFRDHGLEATVRWLTRGVRPRQ